MLKEIAVLSGHIEGKKRVTNIHFGGGSPNLLTFSDLSSILEAIGNVFEFDPAVALAIEIDPRSTTQENIASYAELGFNRISIGIQDFDSVVQQAINRVQSFSTVASIVSKCRAVGFQQINLDIIYGLPFQTPNRFLETLNKIVTLDPDRIALFSYAHVPHIKKHQQMIDVNGLPADSEKLVLYGLANEILVANAYVAIGIDHFSKAGDPLAKALRSRTLKRNFQGYTVDPAEVLIGIGSSAISQFPQGYVQNSQYSAYRELVEAKQLPSIRGWWFRGNDLAHKRVIDELMCFMSVDLGEICNIFGLNSQYFQIALEELRKEFYQEIVEIKGDTISICTPYRMAARVVALVFDQNERMLPGQYSKVT